MSLRRPVTVAGVLFLGSLLALPPVSAQIPDKFTNLQVLPRDISKPELVRIMRGIATDLGARCHHCHVGPEDLKGMDFAADTKPDKRAAREMLKMVQAIHTSIQALPVEDRPRDNVTCYTCHRRQMRPPLPLHEELLRSAEAGGPAAAVERYRALRKEQPEAGRYDFGPLSLRTAAVRLQEAGKVDDALVLAREGAVQHPGSADAHATLGGLLLKKGDKGAAAASFRKALELDPGNLGAARGLQEAAPGSPKP